MHNCYDTLCFHVIFDSRLESNPTPTPPAQAAKPPRTKKSKKQASEPVPKPAPTQGSYTSEKPEKIPEIDN